MATDLEPPTRTKCGPLWEILPRLLTPAQTRQMLGSRTFRTDEGGLPVNNESAVTICSTCGCLGAPDEFYGTSTECRTCKRTRSQQNRLIAARKIALAERFIDVVMELARQGWHPPVARDDTGSTLSKKQPPAVSYHQPEASIGPQEVQP